MQRISKHTVEYVIGGGFFLAALFCIIRSVTLCFSIDIWYDELFSMVFAGRPVGEMIELTARDVHPPLYYMILHGAESLVRLFGGLGDGEGQMAPEVLAKILSTVPFFVLMVYGLTTIRKHFGFVAAGVFSFAIMAMPQMPEYTTEIRMYSYAMLFVTGAMLHGFGLVRSFLGEGKKKWDTPDGVAMMLYSSAAAYTHYYAALAVGIVYGLTFLWMLILLISGMKKENKKPYNYKAFGLLIIIMNLTAVSYIPWIGAVASQVSAVKENYWIQPMGFHSILSAAKHLFAGYFQNEKIALAVGAVIIAMIAVLFVATLLRTIKKRDKNDIFTLGAFMVLPLLVLAGILASILIRPVFVNRYMIPAYGCFWFSVSIMASGEIRRLLDSNDEDSQKRGKAVFGAAGIALLILILIVGFVDYKTFIWNENYRKTEMEKTLSLFEETDPDTAIISNFSHVQALLSYYLNRDGKEYKIYLYEEEPEPIISETLPGLLSIYDPVDISNMLEGGKKVHFFGSFNSRDDILADWNEQFGLRSDDLGSFLMERYWFEDFRIKNY
jgi:hypothetical protein